MFRRPHVLLEPSVERQIVGDAAEKSHRNVSVSVDETGDHQASGGVDDGGGTVSRRDLRSRADDGDRIVLNRDCPIRQDRPGRVHGNDDAAEYQNVGSGLLRTGIIGLAHRKTGPPARLLRKTRVSTPVPGNSTRQIAVFEVGLSSHTPHRSFFHGISNS